MQTLVIQFTPSNNYQANLDKLINIINSTDAKLIVAPEVIITDFDYKNWLKANAFADIIKNELLKITDKIIILTMIEDNKNVAYVFYNQKVVYKREKIKLFGYEKKYFEAGEIAPEIFEIDGVKFAILICFEIRFIEYWQKIKGIDIVIVPAMWGIERKKHLITLSNALALSLQSFVVVADGLAKASGIISPWQDESRNENNNILADIDLTFIQKIRKRLPLE